jgi:4-diphosphocytidyl-2-C-methyl-D-erythritol kinase
MIRETAPAKVNLVLHVGPRRPDGLHELCSLTASIDLADEVLVEPAERDEVVCPGVPGPNLVQTAIDAFRSAVGELPPLRVGIEKRIPVAAGLGGGSADAAAVLRAANELAGRPLDADGLRRVGAGVGSDVPSLIEPGDAVVAGAGEIVEPVDLPEMALLLVPDEAGLSTADVYAEADRIGATRARLDPSALRRLAGAPLAELARGMENDLEAATLSLRPAVAERLAVLREGGALAARVTGSGPTVFGVFADAAGAQRARDAVPGGLVAIVRS